MRFKIYDLRFIKVFLITFILISCLLPLISTPQVLAQEEDATSSVREKVRQAIENLTKKPRAAIGTLDNISDKTLQIKNLQGKISLVATGEKTVFAKYVKGKKSDIKFEDLSLGDFTVAMGYKNGNDTIEASRVLTFDATPFIDKKVIYAAVDSISTKGVITITGIKSNDEWTLDTTSKPKITIKQNGKLQQAALADIEEGDTIIAIGEENTKKAGTLIVYRIHIVQGTASVVSKSSPTTSAKPTTSPTASPKPSGSPKVSPKPSPSPTQ
jgi:hypothetical protein